MVKKRKLRWYGHISRSSGMAKTSLQNTVEVARRRGRQNNRWEDNIKEWTGLGFGDSLRAAEDREGWNGIVATSSVVPQRPPRLRDWDEMNQEYLIMTYTQIVCWNPEWWKDWEMSNVNWNEAFEDNHLETVLIPIFLIQDFSAANKMHCAVWSAPLLFAD